MNIIRSVSKKGTYTEKKPLKGLNSYFYYGRIESKSSLVMQTGFGDADFEQSEGEDQSQTDKSDLHEGFLKPSNKTITRCLQVYLVGSD